MRVVTGALLATLFVCAVFASDVIDAHDNDLEEVVKKASLVLVEFYAPWCGHCKKLAPEWDKAATALKGTDSLLAKLDATVETKAAQQYEIRGYPSIKVFRDGKVAGDYEGGRTADAIVKWVKSNNGPAVIEATAAQLEDLKKEHRVLVVLSEANGEALDSFTSLAKSLRGTFTFATVAGSGTPALTVFKQFDEGRDDYSGSITDDKEVRAFLSAAGLPAFDEIGPDNYKAYVERKVPIGWLFVEPAAESTKDQKEFVATVAKEHKATMSFVWIDATKYGGMASRLGLSGNKFPAFVIDHEGVHFAHDESSDPTQESIAAFVADYKAGNLKRSIRSEKAPVEHTVDGVTTVIGSQFESLVLSYDQDVFIEFYAPWCGHCKKLAPIFDKLGKALKDAPVRIAKIDATANDFDQKKFAVQGFPTLFFVNKETKEITQFEGDRTFDGMLAFIKSKASSPIEAAEVPQDDL